MIFCYNQKGLAEKELRVVSFVKDPYVTDRIRPKMSSIKWKMACGIGMTNIHFITLADNKNDLFDIYPAAVFKQKSIRKSDRVILGVAHSYNSAESLIETMIQDFLKEHDDMSALRAYYEDYVRDHR